jgi:hypothetical protein
VSGGARTRRRVAGVGEVVGMPCHMVEGLDNGRWRPCEKAVGPLTPMGEPLTAGVADASRSTAEREAGYGAGPRGE